MHRHDLGIRRPLAMIEFASLECGDFVWRGKIAVQLFDRRKLFEKIAPSLRHRGGDLRLVIGEIEERRRRAELLSLKEQRRVRPEKEERRQRAIAAGARQKLQPLAARRIRELVMILKKTNEA